MDTDTHTNQPQSEEKLCGVSYSSLECYQEGLNSQNPDIVLLGERFLEYPQIQEELSKRNKKEEGEMELGPL